MTTGAILKIAATPCGAKQNLLAGAADIPSDVDAHSAETGQWATALGDRRDYVSLSQPRSVLVEQPSAFVYENRARLLLRQMELAHRVSASIRTASAQGIEKHLPRIDTLAKPAEAMGLKPRQFFLLGREEEVDERGRVGTVVGADPVPARCQRFSVV